MNAISKISSAASYARCYQLLAMAFAYPDAETAGNMISGEYQRSLTAALLTAAPDLEALVTARADGLSIAETTGPMDIESAYMTAFEVETSKNAVSLYEGSHLGGCDRSQILLEVKSFYLHFGLSVSDGLREPEDHLPAELEFMQFLAGKQAMAEAEGSDAGAYVRAQRDFLDRHLTRWLPPFAKAAEGLDNNFYRTLAWMADLLVMSHAEILANQTEGAIA